MAAGKKKSSKGGKGKGTPLTGDVPKAPGKAAAQLKAEGNEAFKAFKLDKAVDLYSAAMSAAPNDAVYPANRSAALFEAGRYAESIADAELSLSLSPTPQLAAKLALRAARSALWQGDFDAAEDWLAHGALEESEDASLEEVHAQVRACLQAASAPVGAALAAVAAGADRDAPAVTRDSVLLNRRGEMHATGHDSPRSMLEGAPPRSALAEL